MPKPTRRPAAPVSDQLRAAIVTRGMTPYAVAVAAGIAPSIVNRFMSGQRGLTLDSLDAVAGALGLRLVDSGRRPKAARKL